MKKIISSLSALSIMALLPAAAFAQQQYGNFTTTGGFSGFLNTVSSLISDLFPIAVGIAVLAFFYEIIMFIIAAKGGSTDKTAEYKKGILMSLLAIVTMVAFFGIVKIIANTLGVGGAIGTGIGTSDIPTVQLPVVQ